MELVWAANPLNDYGFGIGMGDIDADMFSRMVVIRF